MPMPGFTIVSLAQAAPAQTGAADQPATTTTTAQPDGSAAPGSDAAQKQPPGWLGAMPLVLMVLIVYLLLWRPQQKRQREQRELMSRLKAGDRVMTNGGIFGTITTVKDTSVMIEVAKGVEIELVRAAVSTVVDKNGKNADSKA